MTSQPENTVIIAGLQKGDTRAFNQLFDQYYTALCYFVESILHDKEEAKDIVIVTFSKLWNRREHFATAANVKAFLYIAARNACFDFLKQKSRRVTASIEPGDLRETGDEEEAQRYIIEAELLRRIYQEALNLPPKCREVFELTYFEGLNTSQIADRLHTTVTNVTSQRSRAIQLLKMVLTDRDLLILFLLTKKFLLFF